MKRLDIYFKIAIMLSLVLPLLIVAEFVLVLFPLYQLAGRSDKNAGLQLDRLQTLAHVFKGLMVVITVVLIITVIIGISRSSRKKHG